MISITLLFILMCFNVVNLSDRNDLYNSKLSEVKILSPANPKLTGITNYRKIDNLNNGDNLAMFRSGEKTSLESLPFSKADVKDFTNFSIKYNNIGLASLGTGMQNGCLPEIELRKINQDKSEDIIATANSTDESKVLKSFSYEEKSINKNIKYYLSKYSFNIIETPWVFKKLSSNRFIYQKIFNEDISRISVIKLLSLNNISQVNLRFSLNGLDYLVTNAYFSNGTNDSFSGNNVLINLNSALNSINIKSSTGFKLKEIYVFIDDQPEPLNIPVTNISFYSDGDNSSRTFLVDIIENKGINLLNFKIQNLLDDFSDSQLFKFKYVFINKNKLDICKIDNFSNFAYNMHTKKISTLASDLSFYYKSPDLFSIPTDKSYFNVFIPDSIVPLSVFRNKKFDEEILNAINLKSQRIFHHLQTMEL